MIKKRKCLKKCYTFSFFSYIDGGEGFVRKNRFDKMCEIYYEKVFRYVWVATSSKERAEDITQEVFLIAYEKGQTF